MASLRKLAPEYGYHIKKDDEASREYFWLYHFLEGDSPETALTKAAKDRVRPAKRGLKRAHASSEQDAAQPRIVQRLDDGSIAIEIDGLKYLAITPAQLRDWTKLQNNYDGCQKDSAELAGQIRTLTNQTLLIQNDVKTWQQKAGSFEGDLALAREDTKQARADAARNFSLFTTERELRVEVQQFIPHGAGGNGMFAKLLNLLDKPAVQASFKLGIPIYQTFKCS